MTPPLLALVLACTAPRGGGAGDDDSAVLDDDSGQDSGAVEPPTRRFSYALIADPHVTGPGEHEARLAAAVATIGALPADRAPDLVFVLGDIAWGGGFDEALAALSALDRPWVPILGDNPIQVGDEEGFQATFSDHLDGLAAQVDGWVRAPTPVDNPVEGGQSWLQNGWLDHEGVRFVALDWNARLIAPGWGELPDLHDFPGGTLPFLVDALETLPEGPADRVVLLSHMPLVPGLDLDEQARFVEAIAPWPDTVWGNHAGHLHGNGEATWAEAGLEIRTTDATWDDVNTIRLVQVWSDDVRFTYVDELIEIPDE